MIFTETQLAKCPCNTTHNFTVTRKPHCPGHMHRPSPSPWPWPSPRMQISSQTIQSPSRSPPTKNNALTRSFQQPGRLAVLELRDAPHNPTIHCSCGDCQVQVDSLMVRPNSTFSEHTNRFLALRVLSCNDYRGLHNSPMYFVWMGWSEWMVYRTRQDLPSLQIPIFECA